MKIKTINCKVCQNKMQLFNTLRPYCSFDCGAKYAIKLKVNKDIADWKIKKAVMKEKLLSHSDYLKLLQTIFNKFIRLRDDNLPCITCGTQSKVEYAAGHFYPTTYQYLRFNEDNVHKQCNKFCNMMKSGNLLEYRPALINKIGIDRVEVLDNTRHFDLKLSIPEIKEKIIIYKKKIAILK